MRRRSLAVAAVLLCACHETTIAPTASLIAETHSASDLSSWTATNFFLSAGRFYHAATVGPDGRVTVIGGFGPFIGGHGAEAYNPGTNQWSDIASPGGPIIFTGAATAAGKIYMAGGIAGGLLTSAARSYDPATNSWATVGSLSIPRGQLAVVAGPDGLVYAIGGASTASPADTRVESLDPATGAWTMRPPLPVGVSHAVAAAAGGKIYVVGGSVVVGITYQPTATVQVFDPATNSWTLAGNMPSERQFHSAATGADGRIYVLGGVNASSSTAETLILNPSAGSWSIGVPLPAARFDGAAAAVDGRVYYTGGLPSGGGFFGDALWLDVAPPTPEQQIDALVEQIATLISSGGLSAASASSLNASLGSALAALERGNENAARGELGAFVNKVNALVRSGRLAASAGADLVAAANAVSAGLD